MKNLLNNHFQGIMSTFKPVNDDIFLSLLPMCISDEDNVALVKVPHEAEIVRALKCMHPRKAPGLDGFPPGLFQTQ